MLKVLKTNKLYTYKIMRYHKHIYYADQQEEIKKKLYSILELDEYNSFTLYELDTNIEKQKKIMELLPAIRNYFSLSQHEAITNPQSIRRPYLSIIKILLKTDYNIINTDYRIKEGKGTGQRTQKYFFIEKKKIGS